MNSLDAKGVWVIAKRKGNRVRYRNTETAAWSRWEKAPLDPDYYAARDRLLIALAS